MLTDVADDQDSDDVYDGAERHVLAHALQSSGLSARQAAARMNISDTRLRHIVNGYQPAGRGRRIPVVAPRTTLARIAKVLDVRPSALAAAGRDDAAVILLDLERDEGSIGNDPYAADRAVLLEELQAWVTARLNGQHDAAPPVGVLALWDFDDLVEGLTVKRRQELAIKDHMLEVMAGPQEPTLQRLLDDERRKG